MKRTPSMTIIAAIGENNELGKNGGLIWDIRADLRRFKQLTTGHAVVMGRKTWESLPVKPLPGRLNIVVSRNPEFVPLTDSPDALKASSLEEATALAEGHEIFIIGGESIYRAAIDMADRLEITHVLAKDPDADTWFPQFSMEDWTLASESEVMETPDGIPYKFSTYRRKR